VDTIVVVVVVEATTFLQERLAIKRLVFYERFG
jgi:hypothetical protein